MAGNRITCCTPLPWRPILVRQTPLSCSDQKEKKRILLENSFMLPSKTLQIFSLSKVSGKDVGDSFLTPKTEVVKGFCALRTNSQ